ncbi:MAG: YkuS family protein [Bacillus sp. (in: firmicutes)]
MEKIGVEQSLTNISSALRDKGYDVIELRQQSDAENCACCVVTGLDQNVMGIANTVTSAPVIDADGMTAEQVCSEVESRLR